MSEFVIGSHVRRCCTSSCVLTDTGYCAFVSGDPGSFVSFAVIVCLIPSISTSSAFFSSLHAVRAVSRSLSFWARSSWLCRSRFFVVSEVDPPKLDLKPGSVIASIRGIMVELANMRQVCKWGGRGEEDCDASGQCGSLVVTFVFG